MLFHDLILYGLFLAFLLLLTKPLGVYLYRIFLSDKALPSFLITIENIIGKFCGIKLSKEQTAKQYALSILVFSFICFLFVFLILVFQGVLPLNPQNVKQMPLAQSINTAVSFMTNTNWQSYAGESSVSYFSQMVGLSVQNFLSAAVGLCVAIVFMRAIVRDQKKTLGNFWQDLIKSTIYVFLPVSILLAVVYIIQGIPQNFLHCIHTLGFGEGGQLIPQGPIASQEAIKSLGTNGGGFFNANSAHPYENPTILTSFLQSLSIFLIPAALTYTFGRALKKQAQGWFIFIIMSILFIIGLMVMTLSELYGANIYQHLPIADLYHQSHHIANFEGKEVRFGIGNSVLYNNVSTAASDGGVNSMLDSFTPMGAMVAMINMSLGEIIFGGVGAGFYGFMLFFILSVFIGSLMIGRIPEVFGKRLAAIEMRWVIIALLASPCGVLIFSSLTFLFGFQIGNLTNSGAHGFSEVLYAFISASNNNGSSFSGLNANTIWFNLTTSIAMLIGRFGTILPVIALAGILVLKPTKKAKDTIELSTISPVFGVLVIMCILVIGGLTIFPALALGPIADQLSI